MSFLFVMFTAEITIQTTFDEIYTEELNNKSSAEYKQLTEKLVQDVS